VFGCWHLGLTTAIGLSALGHEVVGLDQDPKLIEQIERGDLPIFEPGLPDAYAVARERGLISFTTQGATALPGAQVLWITFDTPLDDDDLGNAEPVIAATVNAASLLSAGATVLVSSQLPIGSTTEIERRAKRTDLEFAYSPENLRLGRALDSFLSPDRLVAGVRNARGRETLQPLLTTITDKIEWMSVESAEMAKHALNAFLATSIVFTNEIATLCERVGADAREVERALRLDPRVGPRAYVSPGAAFSGGTLGRDLGYLRQAGRSAGLSLAMISSVTKSNTAHKTWALRTLRDELGSLRDRRIAVLGLTYTPETSTLRRSASIELCHALIGCGASIHVHDPRAEPLPAPLQPLLHRHETALSALTASDAVVISTGWPEYRSVAIEAFRSKLVVDANGFLRDRLSNEQGVRYRSVGAAA